MEHDETTQRLHQFVERMGLFWESHGSQRMTGRVLGWLMVCEPPLQSSAQIAEAILASKASISTATKHLQVLGMVEKVSKRGDRATYYRIAEHGWIKAWQAQNVAVALFRELAEEGLAALGSEPPARRKRLEEMHHLYSFLEEEMPKLGERWRQRHAEHPGDDE